MIPGFSKNCLNTVSTQTERMADQEHARITATRAATSRSIRQNNLHRKFDMNHPVLKDFTTFLQSVRGNMALSSVAKETAACVSRYLYWCNNEELSTIFGTDANKFNDYIDLYLRVTTIQASTLKNYCQAMLDFSKYASYKRFPRTHSKGKFERVISNTKFSLRTSLKRRKSHIRSLLNENHLPALTEFSKIDKLKGEIKSLIKASPGLNRADKNTVTSYIITRLALKNASRSSHICNLTLRDFQDGIRIGKVFQVQCSFAKSKDKKPVVTFDEEDFKLAKDYIDKLRPLISKDSESPAEPLFPNCNGCTMKNFSTCRHMHKILRACDIQPFSLTSWRKAVTTKASRQFSQNTRTLRLINQYLCHSDDVADFYYTEASRPAESLESFQSIQKLFKR